MSDRERLPRLSVRSLPRVLVLLASLTALSACDSSDDAQAPSIPTPRLTGLSTASISVGEPLTFAGEGFVEPDRGRVELTFVGDFRHDGIEEPVDLSVEVEPIDTTTVRWPRFGPYRVPFGEAGDQLGTFHGTVSATNHGDDGESAAQPEEEALALELEVLPSLVVHEVTATDGEWMTTCPHLGTRLLSRTPDDVQRGRIVHGL